MEAVIAKIKDGWNKLRSGLAQIMGANVINKIVAVLSNMVITRVLSTADYGTWSFVLNQYTYFSIVSAFGLINGAFQFGAENRGSDKEFAYYKYCLQKGLFVNVALVVVGVFCSLLINPALPGAGVYLTAYIPVILFEYVLNLLTTILRCEDRIKEYARVLNLNTVLIAVCTCAGAFWGIEGVIAGKYAAYLLSVFAVFVMMRQEIATLRVNRISLYREELKELWRFSLLSCVSSAMNTVLYLIDVTMLASLMKDAEQTAIYKVATFAPNALSFIPTSVAIFILPNLIANKNDSLWLQTKVKKYFVNLGLANAGITLAVILFAPLIITILSGRRYLPAVPLFRILIIGYAVSATFRSLSCNILFGLKKVGVNMLINTVASVADIFLNYHLIRGHGAYGAAYATIISESLAAVIAFTYTIRLIYHKSAGAET